MYSFSTSTTAGSVGRAHGWNVGPAALGDGYQWSAFGRRGTNMGTAPSRAEAEEKARQAERDLER